MHEKSALEWALDFKAHISPIEKFVLVMLASMAIPWRYEPDEADSELPNLPIHLFPDLVTNCVMTREKVEEQLERLRRKGLIRHFDGCIELCLELDTFKWNDGGYRFGKGAKKTK